MLSVLLWLWSPRSGPPDRKADYFTFRAEDVMRLAAAIEANLKLPHRITVVSDFPRDTFPSHLGYIPLQEHFGELRRLGGCWLRLKCFAPGMSEVIGDRVAWIDLDSIVTADLTPLFNRREPIVLYKSESVVGQRWNGSVVLFSPNDPAVSHVWSSFNPDTAEADIRALRNGKKTGPRGTDQAHFHRCFDEGTPHWTAADGILHWGRHTGRVLPEHARLVVLPGLEKPDSEQVRKRSPWIRQYWPLPGDFADPGMPVVPWPVVPSVEPARPGRFKSLLKQRQEARDERRRMLNVGTLG